MYLIERKTFHHEGHEGHTKDLSSCPFVSFVVIFFAKR
jgi:hypothetical protein